MKFYKKQLTATYLFVFAICFNFLSIVFASFVADNQRVGYFC